MIPVCRSSKRGRKMRGAKRHNRISLRGLLVFLLLVGGCAGRKSAVREPEAPLPPAGPKVAVAPMENRSNDLDAPEIIRGGFVEQIARQGWNVMPVAGGARLLRGGRGVS